ncbi:hypothetical protein K2173_007227 [Erythroxylum novogranatense]|uniref:Cation efflux protein cytoplasmic domain-containing protein n=1 Tax=Erythroxylum novogranatense TaxID=1862640 RepID=A0AAV8UBT2_9ROSI|nr:hypothetical protein K2173_007227 [Erythroxylum novogranatense]
MGSRFCNSNPVVRSYLLSRFSFRNPSLLQSFNSHLRNDDASSFHHKIPRRWHFGHSHEHPRHEEGESIFRLGLSADIALATGKALTGYVTGSTAIIADAAHSISDIVLSGIALLSFKAGRAPKDKEHPYGHGKFESLGALGISCMLLATAGGITWHAFDVLLGLWPPAPEVTNHLLSNEHGHKHNNDGAHHHEIDMDHPILALSMTVVSISVKEALYWITKRAGERHGSGLMKANAWHHRADAISSVVALIGVGGSILGVKFLDPLAGLFVSGMILKAGLETGYQSVMELVDAAIPVEHLESIKGTILQVEGVKGCHRLRGRRAGSYLFLDVHIEVDPFCSVSAAHGIGERVRHEIHKSYPEIAEVYIHIDPAFLTSLPNTKDEWENLEQTSNISLADENIKTIVSDILSSKFGQKMEIERITHHSLQGKIFLQVEVSMPHNILVEKAVGVAEEAEKEIFRVTSDVTQVSFQLRLGPPIFKRAGKETRSDGS